METVKNIIRTVAEHPYLCMMLGFGTVVSFGLFKLLALVQSLQS